MSKYTLLIYDKQLSSIECEQIAHICNSATIEKLDNDDGHAITCGYYKLYDYSDLGYGYRLYTPNPAPALTLIGKTPIYMGVFDIELENASIAISKFCIHMSEELRNFEGLWQRARSNNFYYSNIFEIEENIDWRQIKKIEEQYRDMLEVAEASLEAFFKENEYTFPA